MSDYDNVLKDHDRRMGFWRGALQASRDAEDAFIELENAPILRDDARRQRRALVLSATITITMASFGLRPGKVEALDLALDGLKEFVVLGAAGAFTFYFLVEFLVYAGRDFKFWRQRASVAHRELISALTREEEQAKESFQGHGTMTRLVEDASRKKESYSVSMAVNSSGRFGKFLRLGPLGLVEYSLPTFAGFAAVARS